MAPSTQRTVLITGCSDGSLGAALALAFKDAGWRVFPSARNLSKTKIVAAAGLEVIQLDTVKPESVQAAATEVARLTGGSLDMLLNNAGAGYSMPVLDIEWDKMRDLFELNVFSLITVTKAFLPLLRASTAGHNGKQRGGTVVNNTSCSSLWVGALPWAGAYNASKAAATNLTENLRLELAPFGIRVVNLMTGAVESTFHENAPRIALPEDSIFAPVKARVEHSLSGADLTDAGDQTGYARRVATQLSKPAPPHWVWAGKNSTTARLATFLPIGTADSVVKKLSGLDEVERRIKEMEGSAST